MNTANAVGYVRVSTEEQLDGYGLDIQKKSIQEYVKKAKVDLIKIFEDAGISGTNGLEKRAGLKSLFEFVTHNNIDYVIVHKYDRLSRDLFLQLFIEKELKKLNVKIISVIEENLSKDDYVSNLMRQLIGAFAEFEKNRIVERLLSGRKHKARVEKRYASSYYPFGYDNYGRLDPKESELVRQMFIMYKNGFSLQDICDFLKKQRVSTKRGNEWSRQSVKNVLTNRIYTGILKWGETEEKVEALRIIDDSLFRSVQKKLKSKKQRARI